MAFRTRHRDDAVRSDPDVDDLGGSRYETDRVADGRPRRYDESTRDTSGPAMDTLNVVARLAAVVAAAFALIIAVIALIRLDWDAGMDAAPVDVVGIPFTPAVAIGTAVVAVVAILAAASRGRGAKLVVGAVLACVGVAILLASDAAADLDLSDGLGWLAIGVGALLLIAALVIRDRWSVRHEEHRSVE